MLLCRAVVLMSLMLSLQLKVVQGPLSVPPRAAHPAVRAGQGRAVAVLQGCLPCARPPAGLQENDVQREFAIHRSEHDYATAGGPSMLEQPSSLLGQWHACRAIIALHACSHLSASTWQRAAEPR